jgi:hypothetical protein
MIDSLIKHWDVSKDDAEQFVQTLANLSEEDRKKADIYRIYAPSKPEEPNIKTFFEKAEAEQKINESSNPQPQKEQLIFTDKPRPYNLIKILKDAMAHKIDFDTAVKEYMAAYPEMSKIDADHAIHWDRLPGAKKQAIKEIEAEMTKIGGTMKHADDTYITFGFKNGLEASISPWGDGINGFSVSFFGESDKEIKIKKPFWPDLGAAAAVAVIKERASGSHEKKLIDNAPENPKPEFRPYGAWTDFNSRFSLQERERLNNEAVLILEKAGEGSISVSDKAVLRRYSGFGGIAASGERGVLYDYYTSPR